MNNGTESTDFSVELVVDVEHREPIGTQTRDAMYELALKELGQLAKGHTDITGANITVKAPHENVNIPVYDVTVTLTFRPNNVVATERAKDPSEALRNALHAVERQVRSKREKMRGH
jgi:ribosome-associated translation inhibitor RaiA